MQIRKIANKDFFNATVLTPAMVVDLAKGLGLTQVYIDKMLSQKLAKGSGTGRRGSNGASDLPDCKLRTIVLQKLQQPNDLTSAFASPDDAFEFEFNCLEDVAPEPDINAAGANTSKQRTRKASVGGVEQKGAYTVVSKKGLKCTPESDPEKYALWQHVWNSGTFEAYYAAAPKKAMTRTGRIITAASEMAWALKSGWIKPVAAE